MSLQTMFQQSTIAGRLMAGMGVVVSMIVIVVGLGLMYLHSLTGQIELLAGNRVPQVITAGRWGASVLDMARHMQTLVVLMDPAEVQLELKAIKEAQDEQAKLQAQIRELGAAGQAGTLLAQIDDARKAYLETHTQFVHLAQGGRLDEAKVALLINVRPAQAAYIDAISRLSTSLAEETREMSRQSAAAYQRSITGFILAALLCVAGAGVVVFLTSRSLRKQLGAEPEYARSAVEQVAGGDLTADLKLDKGDEGSLLFALREMITNLRSMVDETAKGAQSVADTSAQIAQGNLDLSQRTEEQATTLEEAASSMEELTSTVAQNAQDARQASELAAGASDAARKGGETVDGVVNTMDEILDASKKIADIIGVIDSIAFQTNILALNAAVEAARAGEQGRGFAVVAAEVRNLAHRTAVAAKEIKSLISDSTQKVEAGSSRVDAAGHAMVGIVLSVTKVSEHIARIAAASQEQSSRIRQVSTAVKQMDTVVQQNASLVEEAAAATESMKDQAGSLLELVSRFRLNGAQPADGAAAKPILQTSLAPSAKGPAPIRTRPRKDLPAPYFAQVGNSASGTQPKDQGWKEF